MTDILNKSIVLVLNRNWQAIHIRTPQEAFCMMATIAVGYNRCEPADSEDHLAAEGFFPKPAERI